MTAPDRGAVGELIGRLAELRRIGSSGDLEIQLLEREQRALDEAADALARLSARVEELEAALRAFEINTANADTMTADQARWKLGIIHNMVKRLLARGEHREDGDRG